MAVVNSGVDQGILVGIGGAAGAVARWFLSRTLILQGWEPFWSTALINVTGSFLMGWLIGALPASLRPLILVGVLGGYTTFSSFSADQMNLLQTGRAGTWAFYTGLSVGLGLLAFWLGSMTPKFN